MTRRLSCLLVLALFVGGCRFYSFTGASIPDHLGSIAIPLVEDASISTVTGLDDALTELLVDRFVRQTRLSLEPDRSAADALLTARITRYENRPTSVSGDERATRNRVTIAVQVEYTDQLQSNDLLNRAFSAFEEYDAGSPDEEETAAAAVLEKIADDIFTAATSNW